jgi:hypothetical protein
MLKGHYAYFGISGNYERLATLPHQVARIWRKWLSRRSNKRSLPWIAFAGILELFPLPQPRIVHRYAKPRANRFRRISGGRWYAADLSRMK